MRKAFKEVQEILSKFDKTEFQTVNMTFHLGKLTEEVGEVAKEVNKLNGRKNKKGESNESIVANIAEETADAIQCLMAIAITAGVDYETLKENLHLKNKKFAKAVEDGERDI